MRLFTAAISWAVILAITSSASAQFPAPSKEHKILKEEEGKWEAEMTMFMGPEGPYNPPRKSKAKETNRMLGGFWVVSSFEGSFEGLKFNGHGQFGYDPVKKKYVGTWIDSFGPHATKMTGTYDAAKKTMTYETVTTGADGKPSKGRNIVVYGKDTRTMTMFIAAPGTDQMIKVMEIKYKRAK